MTLWEYLDRVGQRRAKIAIERPLNVRLLANVIGCALVFGFLGAIIVLVWAPVPPANKDLLTYMLGQLSGFAGGVVAYHYTSKAGEKELDAQRAKNTTLALEGMKAAAGATTDAVAGKAADAVADAAVDAADSIKGAK
jgi:hypothetical protein